MNRRTRRRALLLLALVLAPIALGWMLLHVAATVAVMVFGFFLWLTTRPLRPEMRTTRDRLTPRFRRRLVLADDHVDEEFRRIVAGEASQEA